MFTKGHQRSWIKIEVVDVKNIFKCYQGLLEACSITVQDGCTISQSVVTKDYVKPVARMHYRTGWLHDSSNRCYQGLREACSENALPYRRVARSVKEFRMGWNETKVLPAQFGRSFLNIRLTWWVVSFLQTVDGLFGNYQ